MGVYLVIIRYQKSKFIKVGSLETTSIRTLTCVYTHRAKIFLCIYDFFLLFHPLEPFTPILSEDKTRDCVQKYITNKRRSYTAVHT